MIYQRAMVVWICSAENKYPLRMLVKRDKLTRNRKEKVSKMHELQLTGHSNTGHLCLAKRSLRSCSLINRRYHPSIWYHLLSRDHDGSGISNAREAQHEKLLHPILG